MKITDICPYFVYKPYLLTSFYCSKKNELISDKECYKCRKAGENKEVVS